MHLGKRKRIKAKKGCGTCFPPCSSCRCCDQDQWTVARLKRHACLMLKTPPHLHPWATIPGWKPHTHHLSLVLIRLIAFQENLQNFHTLCPPSTLFVKITRVIDTIVLFERENTVRPRRCPNVLIIHEKNIREHETTVYPTTPSLKLRSHDRMTINETPHLKYFPITFNDKWSQ